MRNWKRVLYSLPPYLLAWIWSALLVLQMVLAFFVIRTPRNQALMFAGWAVWILGTGFAILPIFTLRAKGGVPEGKSYMETTGLVDTGIYALVRHPQSGTAGILLNLALPLIGQHWLLVVLAAMGIALLYIDTFREDEACIEKFGQEYVRYMERVPRVNFLAGIMRRLVHASAKAEKHDADHL
ncbi:MAG: methyltransferase [Anaerolineae bacterium]|jgi:protein-S-isoprenylcysteine O-methyltransferase Ste14